jgi:hypothetical protein
MVTQSSYATAVFLISGCYVWRLCLADSAAALWASLAQWAAPAHRVALWPKPANAALQLFLQLLATSSQFDCNRSAIGMQQGMQLGMQLVAPVATSSCNCNCNTSATFKDPSKQGLASPRKLHR